MIGAAITWPFKRKARGLPILSCVFRDATSSSEIEAELNNVLRRERVIIGFGVDDIFAAHQHTFLQMMGDSTVSS